MKIEDMMVFCDIHMMEKHGNTLTMYVQILLPTHGI